MKSSGINCLAEYNALPFFYDHSCEISDAKEKHCKTNPLLMKIVIQENMKKRAAAIVRLV